MPLSVRDRVRQIESTQAAAPRDAVRSPLHTCARHTTPAFDVAEGACIGERPERRVLTAPDGLWAPRSDMQQATDRLWITNVFGARKRQSFARHHITHVVVCAQELQPSFEAHYTYLKLDGLTDNTTTQLLPHVQKALPFIRAAHHAGGTVLVHCAAGTSRSAAVLIAYLMWQEHLPYEAALLKAQAARPIISPNPGFRAQLRAFLPSDIASSPEGTT